MAGELVLRPYQQECLEIINRLEGGSHMVVMATGLGKTTTFAQIERKGRVLILSHREELVHQPARYYDCSFGCERAEEHSHGEEVVSASVQTMVRRLRQFRPDEFDMIITDEAHHAAAPTYKRIYQYFRPRLHLGFTATPNRGDRVRLDDVFEDIIFTRNLKWGIENQYLSNIECLQVDIGFNLSKVKRRRGDFDIHELSRAINDAKKNEGIAEAYRQLHKGQTLIFCVDVAHANAVAKHIEGAVAVTAETKNRSEIIEAFTRKEIPAITSVGVFTEGTDLPLIETIIMARPTENTSLYTQMAGRGLRLYPGKSVLRLIDCVGIADKHNLCTAPSLLGLDPRVLPKRQRKKLTGLLTDMESNMERMVACSPESWIISTRNIDVFADQQNLETHNVNWKAGYDGSFTCGLGRGNIIVITPVNELGLCTAYYYDSKSKVKGYFGKNIPLQTAFDKVYDYLVRYHENARMLWDMERVTSGWGADPASKKQLSLIEDIFKSPEGREKYQSDDFELSGLTKYEASIILDRILDKKQKGEKA